MEWSGSDRQSVLLDGRREGEVLRHLKAQIEKACAGVDGESRGTVAVSRSVLQAWAYVAGEMADLLDQRGHSSAIQTS